MLRSVVVVLRPLARSIRCTCSTLKPGITAQIQNKFSQNNLEQISTRGFSTVDYQIAVVSNAAESLELKQNITMLPPQEQEEYAIAELEKLSTQDEKRLKVLEMEYDVWMSTGIRIPTEMSQSRWFQILHTGSRKGRERLYKYWFKREWTISNELEKKVHRQERHLARNVEKRAMLEERGRELGLPDGEIPTKNTINLFVRAQTILKHEYNNMAWAMQYGQSIVMDLSFEAEMKDRERSSLVKQLKDAYSFNKKQLEPFNMVMTGLKENGLVDRKVKAEMDRPDIPITITSDSYLDLYPKESLVYLTPDSPNELYKWSPDDVYIIGAIVDLGPEKPHTLAKAKSERIRTARLPLDKFMYWKHGGKALTLDLFMKIVCELKDTGDWVKALTNIPTKKADIRPQARKASQLYMKRTHKGLY